MDKFYATKKVNDSTVEITITIPKDSFQESYKKLLNEELGKAEIKGFRKGKVPTSLVEPEISNRVKVDTFEKLLPYYITTVVQKESLNPIAPPTYKNFPDLTKDEDLKIELEITVMPDFKIGNLKKIKIEKEDAKITKKEIDDALNRIKSNNKTKTKDINDAWAKEIAKILKIENINSLKDLTKYIEDILKEQKEHVLRHKAEDSAFAQAIKLSNINIPEPAVKYEAEERERSFARDMKQRNVKIEDFLKANNITLERMRELWLKDAQQALESDVFLKIYSKERNIKISDEELKSKIESIRKTAPKGTDTKIFDNPEWIEYIRAIQQKEKSFEEFKKEVLGK